MTEKSVYDSDRHCGATGRQSGKPCKRPKGWGTQHPGTGRCKLHGGASPGGIASPTFKHGRYSKYLPAELLTHYREAMGDAELLSLRDDIALVDARLAQLLDRLPSESAQLWAKTAAAWERFTTAVRERDRRQQSAAVSDLDQLITAGQADGQTWAEITAALDVRRRLAESERKRLVEAEQYITTQQAMILIAGLVGIVKQHVTDRDQLRAISSAVNGLIDRPAR